MLLTAALSTSLWLAPISHAQVGIDPELRPEYSPQGWNEVYGGEMTDAEKYGPTAVSYILADIIVVMLQLAGVLAIYFIVTSGFNYVKAFGRDEEIQKAKKGLTWAIVGLLVVILSYAIVQNIIKIVLTVDQEIQAEAMLDPPSWESLS